MADKYGIQFAVVPIVNTYLLASPVPDDGELTLMAAPAAPNSRIEVVSIDIICADQLVVDGSNDALVGTIVFHDASADADTTLFTGAAGAAGDLLTAVLDLNEVARNAVALFAGTPNADIALHASTDGPLRVKADREHLLRVLNNLIKNATQAIPEDRQGVISVSLRAEGDQAIVEVRDNGTGIPEEVRERIFEPSFTTKSGGMGLGLAMVKRMVEQAGGSVHFTTRMDEGSSFVVSLPLVR